MERVIKLICGHYQECPREVADDYKEVFCLTCQQFGREDLKISLQAYFLNRDGRLESFSSSGVFTTQELRGIENPRDFEERYYRIILTRRLCEIKAILASRV